MTLLDASAVLAWLQREEGASAVDAALVGDVPARVLATNWAEILTVARRHHRDADEVDALLRAAGFQPVAVTDTDARLAAWEWEPWLDLSLADRLCLVASARLDPSPEQVLTADTEWECATNLGGAAIVHIRPLPARSARGFTAWLRERRERDDPVGDLARDVHADAQWLRTGDVRLTEVLAHLEIRGADASAQRAARRAWREWTRSS